MLAHAPSESRTSARCHSIDVSKYEHEKENQHHARSETEMSLLQDHHDRDDRGEPGAVLDADLTGEGREGAVHPKTDEEDDDIQDESRERVVEEPYALCCSIVWHGFDVLWE